jgi:hypothetical protein
MGGGRVFHLLGIDIKSQRNILLEISGVLESTHQSLNPYHILQCSGKPFPVAKGKFISGEGTDHEFHSQFLEDSFRPPRSGYDICHSNDKPVIHSGMGWARFGIRAIGWVCFDSEEMQPETFIFIPVCAPLEGKEQAQPETTRGCLGLAVIQERGMSPQVGSDGAPVLAYRRVNFGGLNPTTSFKTLDYYNFMLV